MADERGFQKKLIADIKKRLPGSVVLKNDASYLPGFPDLTILYGPKWATLECKRSEDASKRPNQEYYVEKLSNMGFSAFIFPENRESVLNDMEQSLKGCAGRSTCIS